MLGALAGLRERLRSRPDTEHEQYPVRLLIGVLLVLYLLPGTTGAERSLIFYVGALHLAVSTFVFGNMLRAPQSSHTRRVLAILCDFSTVTCYMVFFGERAAVLFVVFVWMTLANGFRFGRQYLLLSLVFGVAGFWAALSESPFWQRHHQMGYGLLVAFIALSLYVQSLVAKLYDALARAETANQAKRRFISVVSHELRTPLNAIIGMSDLLGDTSLNREQADMLHALRSSSRVMLGLVEDVLDFSKIEAGKLALRTADFDLHALVNSACRIFATQAAAKNVDFIVSIMPDVPPLVRGDPHYLRQILINLAGNALKFTERGSVTVHLSAHGETDTHVKVKFSVRDTGIGIAPDAQTRIFDSFTQADESTTRRFGGTGLGTTIAKQLVDLMGGQIGLESAVGLGSTFWFQLDFEKQAPREEVGVHELSSARILLVGFPPAERSACEEALAAWGATPVALPSVGEAAARLVSEISTARPYHSVLLYSAQADLGQAETFRRLVPKPAPPLILALPHGADTARFQALSAGFAAVLQFPVDKRQLFNALHSVTAGQDAREGVIRLQDYARAAASGRKLTVLVADDNPTNREVLGKIVERGGHAVTLVEDGDEALDAVERERFDVVILDRNMPGTGGIEALRAIRLMGRGDERIPVIVLSAEATPDARREALEAGADTFLPKPVEALRLLEEINSVAGSAMSRRRAERPASVRAVPPRSPAAGAAVINVETLAQLHEIGSSPAFLENLARVFVADGASLVERMEKALVSRSYKELRGHLHALKGSSASIGADRLTRMCGSLGKCEDARLRLEGPRMLRSLSEELGAVRGELERYMRERQQSAS